MRIETFGKDVEVTPALHEYVETKLQRLGKHFDQHCEVRVTLELRKNEHHVDASANVPGQTLHAEAGGQTMYAAIDILADKLDRLVIKHKEKKQQHAPLPVGDNDD
ncbi:MULTISPECIES: ribosome hibernation-promoting factor, HPF/YfiA family [Stenotrophomonas]|jgi:putative sigma-54 modulation protein|uniref:ribosome hibernation-promoting factor, HPF/YfiA family n=1 Tax=Stenotrophomonas TaxID=40323 RepID=UPI000456A8B8|nr:MULTISPECIES: ribosome-associated translation inhibitor RaiA [Stenotrophomonas]MCF7749629.1 ribosome-associated translation inhibitor RaiA [Bacillus subtilis subsp. subtilis]AHY59987.1 ribosome hibernation promoting factor HPF [Stenotrophomonas rhizophila]MDY0955409.1 ribosome-associated translation inhibitor RaiA [Stenotrophomonas rhizophila]PTT57510.1 ribosome-associated translation inhibitor RaiA [Stenotrophomonas sp. HMWF003]QHB70427.1 ribosome-associated translation inhibitor RaiA [Ste